MDKDVWLTILTLVNTAFVLGFGYLQFKKKQAADVLLQQQQRDDQQRQRDVDVAKVSAELKAQGRKDAYDQLQEDRKADRDELDRVRARLIWVEVVQHILEDQVNDQAQEIIRLGGTPSPRKPYPPFPAAAAGG